MMQQKKTIRKPASEEIDFDPDTYSVEASADDFNPDSYGDDEEFDPESYGSEDTEKDTHWAEQALTALQPFGQMCILLTVS